MSIRTIATLAVAVVLGLIAVVILNGYLGARNKAQPVVAGAAGTPVVVAAVPIGRGMAMQPTLLKVVNFPPAAVPMGAVTKVTDITTGPQRLALRGMTPGEPILTTEITGPGNRLTLSTVLDPGMQAVSIRSTDVTGVAGFVLPGDRVDVLLTRTSGKDNDPRGTVTQIIAENVRVMGIDQSDNDEADKPSVAKAVTLQVTPAQAQLIALGESVGSVSLALRHVTDSQALARRATTAAELGFVTAERPVTAPATTPVAATGGGKPGEVPLYGPGIVRVTRVTDISGYRLER